MAIRNILFDLDGTLTDSKKGIIKSIQYALKKLNRSVPSGNELNWCLGPPLIQSFRQLLETDNFELAQEALALYRERYNRVGKFENQIYDDIPKTLNILKENGFSLFVATSKPYFFTEQIMNHFELASYFEMIYGSELNGDLCDKTDLINHVIQNESLDRQQTAMVGDRKHDILGAVNNHIKSIGVTYGYGSEDELRKAGADFLVSRHLDLPELLKDINAEPVI